MFAFSHTSLLPNKSASSRQCFLSLLGLKLGLIFLNVNN